MELEFMQILLIGIVAFIAGIDQGSFLKSLYQPIVLCPVVGLILGDPNIGLVVGGTYQLITIGSMPVGGAQPPNVVIGGIMATVFAVTAGIDTQAALGLAVPFALLGQYGNTLILTLMSPIMSVADKYAKNADTKGIENITYFSMVITGGCFAIAAVLGCIGGAALGVQLTALTGNFIMGGLGIAGGMMRYVGFAILMNIMLSNDMWGFYFSGFAAAALLSAAGLAGPALVLVSFVGIAIALYDFQSNVKFKDFLGSGNGGSSDGI